MTDKSVMDIAETLQCLVLQHQKFYGLKEMKMKILIKSIRFFAKRLLKILPNRRIFQDLSDASELIG